MTTVLRPTPHRDDDLVLALLNSSPVIDGEIHDELADDDAARDWIARFGGARGELAAVRRVRDDLQAVVCGDRPATVLADVVRDVRQVPEIGEDGVTWSLAAPAQGQLAVRAVLGWSAIQQELPGRLRACANDECRRFLLDRSRANTARWCSMATCGNRLKARRHHERTRARRG
jgi:predicted RNA-binding Zn ribbon-like protein